MKKYFALIVICLFLASGTTFAAQNKPLTNIGNGMKEIVYGTVETPDNINGSNQKGTALERSTDTTKDDVGRTIVKVFRGAYQLATFWYPRDN